MHHEAAWYLEWVVKEGIEFKPHAKHLAPGLRLLGYYKNKIPSTPPTKAAPNPASAPSTRSKAKAAASTAAVSTAAASTEPMEAVRAVLLRMKKATVLEVPALIDEALALCA